ncbi:MAG: hypothetical protein E3J56_08360 [Candidatus Aminicenantes bacterium]|nr:MAG: hypothetical protein E3J56_08360 [Candidatus Aminicenantes bacterium]
MKRLGVHLKRWEGFARNVLKNLIKRVIDRGMGRFFLRVRRVSSILSCGVLTAIPQGRSGPPTVRCFSAVSQMRLRRPPGTMVAGLLGSARISRIRVKNREVLSYTRANEERIFSK